MSSCFSIIYIWCFWTCFNLNKESSVLTIKYFLSFFLVFKLYKFCLQIIHLNSDDLRFLGSVDIRGFLWWYNLKDKFELLVNFQMFFLVFKLCGFGFFIKTYFRHGQCFIWEFLVFAFIETARLNTFSCNNFSWSWNDTILFCKLYISSLYVN